MILFCSDKAIKELLKRNVVKVSEEDDKIKRTTQLKCKHLN